MSAYRLVLCVSLLLAPTAHAQPPHPDADPKRYLGIEVVDDATGRGVPMVELQATTGARYYTDSAGRIAFYEPGLMNRKVFFGVAAHGYEFAKDGFGIRGVVLETAPGTSKTLKIKRLNIAERLYRMTGYGIYRDSVLLGHTPPVPEPLLNGEVTGQDGILTAVHRGKTYWFYGDTGRLAYALGNFAMAGATSDAPEKLDPERGIALKYFTGPDGFARRMAPREGPGVVWLFGLSVLPDASGADRMVAYFQRKPGLEGTTEEGFMAYNDAAEVFEKIVDVPVGPAIAPAGYPSRMRLDGADYVVFTAPYPAIRVKADWTSYIDVNQYEGYTPLKPGTRYGSKDAAQLDRDASGKLVWAWKRGTPPLSAVQQEELIAAGRLARDETPFRLADAETGKPVLLNNASCSWNDYRKKYLLIASEMKGATMLGEVWYAEADRPEGPWTRARKIITHANKPGDAHDFYNPTQHPFLDREGGRVIYIEGSYVNTFSGNPHPTPYYEYNQVLYRLDLADPRLRLSAE
jgi:hypothetical protein